MAGLLGSMVAGGVKGYADSRVSTLEKQEDFNLKKMLMDAEVEKTMMLKKLGYELDDERAAKQAEKRAGYFEPVEEEYTTPEGETATRTRERSTDEIASDLFKKGEWDDAKGLLSLKQEKKVHTVGKGQKLVDSEGNLIAEGNKDVELNEMILRASQGDKEAKAFLDTLSAQEIKKAVASRAPKADSNIDEAYKDWKKKPGNENKGRDDFEQFRAGWGKDDGLGVQEVTEKPLFNQFTGEPVLDRKTGKPIKETAVKRKERVPTGGGLKKDKDGNYVWTR